MCSLNGYGCNSNDNNETSEDTKNLQMKDLTLCRKCRCKNVDILLSGQSGYCKICFLIVINHKFRSTLGKSKIVRRDDSILVDHTGEANSTVLLHLIKIGMSESACKKLIFKTTVLYIDDNAIIGKAKEDRDILLRKIAEQTKILGFNGYIISLSQVLNKENTLDIKPMSIDDKYQWADDENDRKLCEIMTNLTNTSKTDLLNHLRRKLLLSTAEQLKCNKIFVADSAMDIATKVLADTCLGRGAELSALATFCDTRCSEIEILKPMRDFIQQELAYYLECHELDPVKPKMIDITAQPTNSIHALAYNFTMGLESQFPGTVFNIFRTAEKLSAKKNEHQDEEYNCILCDARINSTFFDDKMSALTAIKVSKLMSSKYVDEKQSLNEKNENGKLNCINPSYHNQGCCNDNSGECSSPKCDDKKNEISSKDILRYLCYSCKLIYQNSDILSVLPASIFSVAQKKFALENMREEINDLL